MALHLHPLPGDETGTKMIAVEARYCPNCHKPIGNGEVYRAGYEIDNFRTIPPTYGRGQYCDHINPDLLGWGEPVGAFTSFPPGDSDSAPSELHILQWEDEPPTLWQRFMAWLTRKDA
jgi:hypothetical protein